MRIRIHTLWKISAGYFFTGKFLVLPEDLLLHDNKNVLKEGQT